MLESTVELLNGLFFIAMILLTAVCIVGSIVAALQAVNRGTATSSSIPGNFVDDMSAIWSWEACGHLSGNRKESSARMTRSTSRIINWVNAERDGTRRLRLAQLSGRHNSHREFAPPGSYP
jgi:hypothetical protein